MSELRSSSWSGVTYRVCPSGVELHVTNGDGRPRSVVLDLADVRQLVIDGMAPSGWADHLREELRDLYAGVGACETCGSIRGVRVHGWDGSLLCEVHWP